MQTTQKWILALLWGGLVACGGGGVNVNNGLVSTVLVSDVEGAVVTSPAQPAFQVQSDVGEAQLVVSTPVTLATVTRAILHLDAVEYLVASTCDRTADIRPMIVRIAGPFAVSITDGIVTPAIPDVEMELGEKICGAMLAPRHRRMVEAPPPPNLDIEGFAADGRPFHVQVPSPPTVVFADTEIDVDDEVISVELVLPVTMWLAQIARIASDIDFAGGEVAIDQERHPDAAGEIGTTLPSSGTMRRRPRP